MGRHSRPAELAEEHGEGVVGGTDEVDLLVWGDRSAGVGSRPVTVPPDGRRDRRPPAVAEALASTAPTGSSSGTRRSVTPTPTWSATLVTGRADAWHGGLALGLAGEPEEHDYIHPIWPLSLDAGPDVEAVSWRCRSARSWSAARSASPRRNRPGVPGRHGAGLELGRRLIDRGAVVMSAPTIVPTTRRRRDAPLGEHDRFVFLTRVFGRKWVRYAAVRRARWRITVPTGSWRGLRSATARVRPPAVPVGGTTSPTRPRPCSPQRRRCQRRPAHARPLRAPASRARPAAKADDPRSQVIVVDQNDAERRDHALYAEYADLNLRVVFQDQRGQWLARNAAVQASSGEWIAFIDDDSEVGPDFIEQHLEGLARYDADLSTGASLAVIGAPVPDNYAFFRVADQWDSGNGMCHRSLLERFGLFDQQFDRQRRGDAEFGLRVQLGGGLVIHNPHAIRVHLKAQEGGLRTFGSLDGFRHRDRSSPLPLPSMVYYTKRYHSPRQVREDLVIGLTQAIVPYELKRRASPAQWVRFLGRRADPRPLDRSVGSGPRCASPTRWWRKGTPSCPG